MKTKLLVCLIFLLVGWMFLAGNINSAEVKRKSYKVPISTLAPAPENYIPPRPPSKYPVNGIKYSANCVSIAPEMGVKIEHSQIGTTWYDFQQNGSMGRMISVTNQGYRHFSWMYVNGVYPGNPRYVYVNGEDSLGSYIGQRSADGGTTNAGYCNQTHLQDGASILIYHRTAGSPIWYTSITSGNSLGSNLFDRHWDIPDYITSAPSGQRGMWPQAEVKHDTATGRDYIHVVMTEGNTAGGVPVMVAYERCYIEDGPNLLDTMICQSFQGGSIQTYKVVAGANGGGTSSPISHFDSSCSITPVVVVSPVSERLAIAFLKPADPFGSCDYGCDVCFIESMVNGNDWIAGSPWPASEYNITHYGTESGDRAFSDLSACYDYRDSLHIIWVATSFDSTSPGTYTPSDARLYHWSKKTGISTVAQQSQPYSTNIAGAHNSFIAKPSISADNPLFHPTGDTVYLFSIFTRFDTTDIAANGFGNGDIIISGSNNGGANWGGKYNLTNTQTDNCALGNCLSEHWSSLAQNMYDGDFHIQYICDKDAGGAIQDSPSAWMENPVMYLRLRPYYPPPPARICYRIESPAEWNSPPLKVSPNGSRSLVFKIFECNGYFHLIYQVNTNNTCISCNIPPSSLPPGDSVTITAVLSGSGACNNSFISGNIRITSNDPNNPTIGLPVQAVVANNYFECPRDPSTYDSLDNGILQMYVNANGQEWIHDRGSFPDTVHEVFSNGGLFVATTESNDTLVGRYYGDNDQHTFAREKLYLSSMYNDFWLEYSWNVSIHDLNPPVDTKWWWFEILHENVFFKSTAPDALKHCVIKFVTVEIHDPPIWWPSQPTFTGYEDTYIGMMMDMDAPWDTLGNQNGRNRAGYDAANNIAYQRGWDFTGAHPEYNDYYTGMALIQGYQPGESTVPWGTYNLRNDVYLYPQSPWGWKDGQFYQLAKGNVPGEIQASDSIVDRSQIVTALKISAGTDPKARSSFTLVETAASGGLSQLQAYVDSARTWVAGKPLILCGDCNCDGREDIGDVICKLNFLYKWYSIPTCGPSARLDCNSSGTIDVGDIIAEINYLYKGYPASSIKCPGVW
jgi:hypothetical protein